MNFTKELKGDGTVPFWSADLGGTNSSKTYYAANREHTGKYENNAVAEEGLVVSANSLQMVKNIINNNPSTLPSGITKTRPAV